MATGRSAIETVSLLLAGVALGGFGHWGYNKQVQKADTALEANSTLVTLLKEVKTQGTDLLNQYKTIAPGVQQANRALSELKGKVSDFKDLDLCIVSDDIAKLLDNQLAAYNKNRTPNKDRVPKN